MSFRHARLSLLLLAAALAVGCGGGGAGAGGNDPAVGGNPDPSAGGGGGGGGGPLPPLPPPPTPGTPDLGANASLHGRRIFPDDDPWNTAVDAEPVDPDSDVLIASIGLDRGLHPDFGADWDGGPFGIPYVVVSGSQPKVPMAFEYDDESDLGPYPIPADAPIEGGASSSGDRHVLVIDRDAWKLYETFASVYVGPGWSVAPLAIRPSGDGMAWQRAATSHRLPSPSPRT